MRRARERKAQPFADDLVVVDDHRGDFVRHVACNPMLKAGKVVHRAAAGAAAAGRRSRIPWALREPPHFVRGQAQPRLAAGRRRARRGARSPGAARASRAPGTRGSARACRAGGRAGSPRCRTRRPRARRDDHALERARVVGEAGEEGRHPDRGAHAGVDERLQRAQALARRRGARLGRAPDVVVDASAPRR